MLRIQYVNFIDKILMFREHFNNKNSLNIGHLPWNFYYDILNLSYVNSMLIGYG